MRFLFTILTIGLFHLTSYSHSSGQRVADERLSFYADALSNSFLPKNRKIAQDSFSSLFGKFLSEKRSFERDLDFLPWLSVQYPKDSTFRIITWEFQKQQGDYEYFGCIQRRDGKVIYMNDNVDKEKDLEYRTLEPINWYGAKYYQVYTFDHLEGKAYLLLGYDGYSKFNRRRIAETLYMTEDEVKFGIPVFGLQGQDLSRNGKCRIIMEYSLEVRVVMKVEEDSSMLIKDHMVPVDGRFSGQGATWVPDGSYEGYRLKDGNWWYEDKIYHLILDKPPGDIPSELLEKRDLFGNKRGG
jgi:hypothetical protein